MYFRLVYALKKMTDRHLTGWSPSKTEGELVSTITKCKFELKP